MVPIHIHACTDCDGLGGARVEEPGEMTTWWTCEGCEGSGETTSCRECGDPMSRPAADRAGYRCDICMDTEDRRGRELALLRGHA